MKPKRKPRKHDVFTSIDGRRKGLTIQILVAHSDGTCTVRNDYGRIYRVLARRLNGHGHWRLVGNPREELTDPLDIHRFGRVAF